MRLPGRKGNGERRGTVGSGGKSEIGKRLYVPYIWIRKCILFSDGCGALERKKKTKKGAVSHRYQCTRPPGRNRPDSTASNGAIGAFGTPVSSMKSGRKNGLKAKKEEADAASYVRCCRSGMDDEGCIQQAILCANVKTSLVTSRVPSLAGVVYVRC